MKMTEEQEAEAGLERLAAERKRTYEDKPATKIRLLKEYISKLKGLRVETEESIRASIKDVDSRGNIILRSMPGVATDFSLNAIVRTNQASRRERANAIDEAILSLEIFIQALKPTGSQRVPEDLEAFCADLVAKLPNRDEEVLEYSPPSKKEDSALKK